MKTKWKVALMFERRIESEERMVLMPFVKLTPVKGEGDMYFSVPGGKVEYAPEQVETRETPTGVMVKHVVLAAGSLVDRITSPEGVVWNRDAEVTIDLSPTS